MNTLDKPLPTGSTSEETIKGNIREMNYPPAEDIMRKDEEVDAEPQQVADDDSAK